MSSFSTRSLIGNTLVVLAGLLLFGAALAYAEISIGPATTGESQDVVSTELVLAVPAGAEPGDLLLTGVSLEGGSGADITAPEGWHEVLRTDNGEHVSLISYSHTVEESEPAEYVWQLTPGMKAVGGISRYGGVDADSPIGVSAGSIGRGKVATAPSVLAEEDGTVIVALFAAESGLARFEHFSVPEGMEERYEVTAAPRGPALSASDVTMPATGETGPRQSVLSKISHKHWAAQQIALRPKPDAPQGIFFDNFTWFPGSPNGALQVSAAEATVVLSVVVSDSSSVSRVDVGDREATLIAHNPPAGNHTTGHVYLFVATDVSPGLKPIQVIGQNFGVDIRVHAASYGGVDQINPIDQVAGTTTLSSVATALSLTPSQAGEWALSFQENNGAFPAVDIVGMTTRDGPAPHGHYGDSDGEVPFNQLFTQGWTSSGPQAWSMIMATLRPAM